MAAKGSLSQVGVGGKVASHRGNASKAASQRGGGNKAGNNLGGSKRGSQRSKRSSQRSKRPSGRSKGGTATSQRGTTNKGSKRGILSKLPTSLRGSASQSRGATTEGGTTEGGMELSKEVQPVGVRRKRMLFVIVAVVTILLAIAVAIGLIIFYTWQPSKPKKPDDDGLDYGTDQMTQACAEKLNGCGYFPDKYVKTCGDQVQCASLWINMENEVESYPSGGGDTTKVKLEFYLPNYKEDELMSDVPEDTPCEFDGGHGRCKAQQCVPSKGNDADKLKHITERPGKWSKTGKKDKSGNWKCVHLPKINNFFAEFKYIEKDECVSDGEKCNPFTYKFLSCDDPLPSGGGKPCWNVTNTESDRKIPENQWPIQISNEQCSSCNTTPDAFKECEIVQPCSYEYDLFNPTENDFNPCCLKDEVSLNINRKYARCVLGSCVAVVDHDI